VFNDNLSDLSRAQLVDGIGPQKQSAIDLWRRNLVNRLPALLAGDFPGKNDILRRYAQEISHLEADITKNEAVLDESRAILAHVNKEIGWLSTVRSRDFERTMTIQHANSDTLNHYLLGSFPPWEPMPDWFALALEIIGSSDMTLTSDIDWV
jgi:hypothetical protein